MIAGTLVDPHTRQVKKSVSARALWVKLLQNRMETGEPYLMFEDAVQQGLPDVPKEERAYKYTTVTCVVRLH